MKPIRAKRVTVIIETDDHIEAWQAENPEAVALRIDIAHEPCHVWWYTQPPQVTSPQRKLGVDVECGALSELVSAAGMDNVAELLKRVGPEASAAPEEEH